ncbi:MAG: ACT domain-containing protein [Candidatus Micrarchaeota archaeon]
MKTITIVADDKVGLLADISYVLAKSKINIESVNVDVIAGKAIITIGMHDTARGKTVVEAAGYTVEDPETIVIKLRDEPGELSRVTDLLKKEGISINSMKTLSKDGKFTILSLLVDKHKKGMLVLGPVLVSNEQAG